MREIKFRFFLKEEKRFYEPYAGSSEKINELLARFASDTEVSMSQYTGLKDKNGTPIYEGDIIIEIGELSGIKTNRVVKYKDSAGAFLLDNCLEFAHKLNIIEVIGNIYENKELLEEETPCP